MRIGRASRAGTWENDSQNWRSRMGYQESAHKSSPVLSRGYPQIALDNLAVRFAALA
ncbi:hypothetical protein PSAB6_70450 [Paraburkholderia sabiae]|nr:hypothetical protein PSAB6_70450 [Paraburkholderia sabiae]